MHEVLECLRSWQSHPFVPYYRFGSLPWVLSARSGCEAALWSFHVVVFDNPLSVSFLESRYCGVVASSQYRWVRLGVPPQTLLAQYPK
jgi:hypothetical protein